MTDKIRLAALCDARRNLEAAANILYKISEADGPVVVRGRVKLLAADVADAQLRATGLISQLGVSE